MEVELIEDKKEIEEIINNKIKDKKLIFSNYYRIGILKRGIEHEKVIEVFNQFDKVKTIEKENLPKGDIGYELFYSLSNNTTFSIATIPKDDKLIIVHAVEYKRKLDHRFKKFKL